MKQPVVHLREGALAEIGGILEERAADRVFFVVDQVAYHSSGAVDVLESHLAGRTVTRFSDFEPNPNLRDIERGITQFATTGADVVVALGGGTAIDVAKSITRLAGTDVPPREIVTGSAALESSGPPLIAIPTTAGTGSETTHFAVVYIDGVKHSLAHDSVRPDYALIDPLLTHSLPPGITAASGLDALCQAAESFWAVAATDQSIDYAAQALQLALTHLIAAVHQPTPASRFAMSKAGHLAGQAINLGKTTAPHALSYAITTEYSVPHGLAVALTLAPTLRYNAQLNDDDCIDPRGSKHVRARISRLLSHLGCSELETACEKLEDVIQQVGGPTRFSQIGVTSSDAIERLAEQVNAQRLSNNPRALDNSTLKGLLNTIR